MANSVTHVIVAIVILDLFRHYVFGKKRFPRYLLVIGGIAGLAPDIDVPLTWLYHFFTSSTTDLHGLFTHSLFFVFSFLGIALLFQYYKNIKWAKIFYVISFGWFMHLILDCLYGGYKTFFWPLHYASNFCPQWGIQTHAADIDAIILVLWLIHEEVHERIKDYI
ncbi:metal-dependent hydrolase [Candidatus Woesearchaeota archaeon]|nr:metal-dependent hydrolase [Candidatus Woesearchaeota archaeon]